MLGGAIGILFEVGKNENPLFESLYSVYDKGRGFIELKEFLQSVDFTRFWTYEGSLAEPPCPEGVKWTVINDVQTFSQKQKDRFIEGLANDIRLSKGNGNSRITQPLNGRKIYYNDAESLAAASLGLLLVWLIA